jgi:beta-1,4-mannosyltransferase
VSPPCPRSSLRSPRWLGRLPRALALPLKALLQLLALLWMALLALPRPAVILLQLPPALPTMAVCWLAARRHRARLVFDWHNFAFTLMALGMGRRHALVRAAERYERFWGRRADAALCVTRAMQQELAQHWRVPATPFHDRPPRFFARATLRQRHELLRGLAPALARPMHPRDWAAAEMAALPEGETLCTRRGPGGGAAARADRPALLVSSTSWTPDEDFGLLLAAAELYDSLAVRGRRAPAALPRLLVCVTGRGPQRAAFEARMRALDLRRVAFRTLWLDPGDYPLLLGSADLGVSLHASSSGLDLPMKVVDMFGAGLPVCALSYPCIQELVCPGRNGLLFSTPQELAEQRGEALAGFPWGGGDGSGGGGGGAEPLLARLRRGAEESGATRWDEAWRAVALPVLEGRPPGVPPPPPPAA